MATARSRRSLKTHRRSRRRGGRRTGGSSGSGPTRGSESRRRSGRTYRKQHLAAARPGSSPTAGHAKRLISDEGVVAYAVREVGGPDKGQLAFQAYYDE